MYQFKPGDTVRHKEKKHLNGGVAFNVIDVDNDNVLCSYFDSKNSHVEEWFDKADLILVNESEGGFLELK